MSKNTVLNYTIKKFGPYTERRDYSNTKKNFEIPDYLDVQRKSFQWFLDEGINEAFNQIYPIKSGNQKIEIQFPKSGVIIEKPENENKKIKECKQKNTSYTFKISANLRKFDLETGIISKEEKVLFGEIPLMTNAGTFIVNGSEKVIVSQLLRSPGAYFGRNVRNKQADDLFNKVEVIPHIGSWLEISHKITSNNLDTVKIKIDKHKNISLSVFLRALGFEKESGAINELFGNSPVLLHTLEKDSLPTSLACREAIYRVIRKGDRVTDDAVNNLIAVTFFNDRRYNLSKIGRYMLNNKLNLIERIEGTYLAQDLVSNEIDPNTGEPVVLFEKGMYIDYKVANKIQESFNQGILPLVDIPGIDPKVVYAKQLNFFPKLEELNKVIIVKVWPNLKAMESSLDPINVVANDPNNKSNHLIISDIVALISYYFNLIDNLGKEDDPDSLVNKRVSGIGELLYNQLKIALNKLEKSVKERMTSKEIDKITPKNVTNNKPFYNQFKTFFNSSKLSQFMDQYNPLSEISNKRRITSLGPGGLNRDTAQFDVRDVHTTHYGRICPIETPEGQNIGLILNYASCAKLNEHGFIQAPYFKVTKGVVDFSKVHWLTVVEEIGSTFAQSTVNINEQNMITDESVIVRYNHEYIEVTPNKIDYIDVTSRQITSISASSIPFIENDDANRALMGSNMQRQAVPLIKAEAPFIATGSEYDIAKYASTNIKAEQDGVVVFVDAEKIIIKDDQDKEHVYELRLFEHSNQGTLITQKPIVELGQEVKAGDLIVDGPSTDKGELALGKNILVAFTTWYGYNYEDGIVVSERLVKDDVLTSVQIEEQIIKFRKSKAGDDILTYDVPNASNLSKRNLDENGIVRIGSEVVPGDILVGRTSPKVEDNPTPEEKLMFAVFNSKSQNQKDTSLKVKNGHGGTVIDVQVLSVAQGDILEDGIDKIIKVLIAQKRKIKVGDKLAGRHGNKGVISLIAPVEDMPYLEDGTPVDILLNPHGIISRMNIGQVLEMHLGAVARKLNVKFVSPVFDGIKYDKVQQILEEAGLPKNGKVALYDGRTGKKFDNEVTVGIMYMLKLYHMVDDKMHARSIGPYSLITQQPLGGKAQNGGQRFGEMETWAIESFGASNILQELLTYKSDNIDGRNQLYSVLASGGEIPEAGTPESFNVLAYELRALGIKLEVHKKNDNLSFNNLKSQKTLESPFSDLIKKEIDEAIIENQAIDSNDFANNEYDNNEDFNFEENDEENQELGE